jgi:hypothetical protein
METIRIYNETWNSNGKLIKRVTIDVTTFEDGTIEENIILTEEFVENLTENVNNNE